jgi:hypothetical protein
MRLRFLKPVLTLTLILAALLAWPIIDWFSEVWNAVIAAWAIGLGNTLLGMLAIEVTLQKSTAVFMAVFFGGMGIRVFLILLVFAFLLSEGFDAMTLTFFLMGFYFAYVVIEVRYLVRVLSKRRDGMQLV